MTNTAQTMLEKTIAKAICCPDGCMKYKGNGMDGLCFAERESKETNVAKSTTLVMTALRAAASAPAQGAGDCVMYSDLFGDNSPNRRCVSEVETVGWAILQALHEGVEEGPQSWSDLAEDQEKRIKKAAVAAIEAVTDLSQYTAQGFSWPAQGAGEPVAYQQFKDGKWVECSAFVAKGWENEVSEGCRALYLGPSSDRLDSQPGTLAREALADRLDAAAINCASDYDYNTATDMKEAARILRGTMSREEVARIIDPEIFAKYDTEAEKGRRAQNGKPWCDVAYGIQRDQAFAKADAILALTPSHETGTERCCPICDSPAVGVNGYCNSHQDLAPEAGTQDDGRVPERETWWLIERKGHGQYTTSPDNMPGLSSDPWRACRFKTEREANDARLRLSTLRDECVVTEHVFINKRPESAPEAGTQEPVAWQQTLSELRDYLTDIVAGAAITKHAINNAKELIAEADALLSAPASQDATREAGACQKCGAQVDERFDCCEVNDATAMDDFIRAILADNNPRSDEPYATVAKWIRKIRLISKPATRDMNFFSENVDCWGASEWFDRLARAVREQDVAVIAKDEAAMDICRNVAASSAMRLVRDYEQQVRAALASRADRAVTADDRRIPIIEPIESVGMRGAAKQAIAEHTSMLGAVLPPNRAKEGE